MLFFSYFLAYSDKRFMGMETMNVNNQTWYSFTDVYCYHFIVNR